MWIVANFAILPILTYWLHQNQDHYIAGLIINIAYLSFIRQKEAKMIGKNIFLAKGISPNHSGHRS